MSPIFILIAILLPILGGAIIPLFHFEKGTNREKYVISVVLLTSVLVFFMLFNRPEGTLTVVPLSSSISIAFRIDGLSMVFGGLLAGLWPLASCFAFEYMKHEGKENTFFTYYTMTYGVALGVAFSANLITMYLCYELLTLITLPIIMHAMDEKAIHAGRKYLIYSIAGAAFAFMGVMVLYAAAGTTDFTFGGLLTKGNVGMNENWLLIAYLVAFLGFGVKAAVFPFHGWLPTAGVAPTPVTALLHAVAVVKAGVFAIIRVTYYGFGTDFLSGTWAHYVVASLAIITIVFGSSMAVKEQHLKRRLAYSTVSNLSYILLGVTMMTPEGLAAGLAHMIFHGVMKICLFFCAGAIMYKTHREFVYQIKGFGRKMPVTMACFAIGSLALVGVPGLCGFVSKYSLAIAAIDTVKEGTIGMVGVLGVVALMISAILTAIYLFTIVIKAYFPGADFDYNTIANVEDPNYYMKAPLIILCVLMLIFGLHSAPLLTFFRSVATGLI